MQPDIKNKIKEHISSVCGTFDLSDILTNSFSYQYDHKLQISATDMAYAITSLLENPSGDSDGKGDNNTENVDPNMGNTTSSTAAAAGKPTLSGITDVHQRLYDNFFVAYDALDLKRNNTHLLKHGIGLAKDIQQAIVRVGNSLIDKKLVKNHNKFRYLILENAFLKDTKVF